MTQPLTQSVLRRLTAEAFLSFLSESEKFEAVVSPGCAMALCNEPVADLNGIVVGRGASEDHFADACRTCLSRQQPFLAIVFPEAGDRIKEVAAERRFFLGATPAGYRLYEGLGFETQVAATVWVAAETSQA